uniref:Uncharacterized protein n=1 Tax=Anguilla anguilla TaxID=7936 RepID=A0A0E9SKZ4_ANGAN
MLSSVDRSASAMAGPIPDPVLRPSDSEMYLNKNL